MFPKEVDGFCDHNEFAICGFMKPAREVGGDLYNYFMIDNEHLGFTIGDVSDKGIPAALFMSMTNTLIKSIALTGITPADVLYRVNNELCKGNEQSMFVTLFFAKMNIYTGQVEYPSVSVMIQSVIEAMNIYVEGFVQSDDITVLALRYH